MLTDSPEAGEAGELEAGDSTICSLFWLFSLSSLHSELGETEDDGVAVLRTPRCQSFGPALMSNLSELVFFKKVRSRGITLGSGFSTLESVFLSACT